MRNEEHVSELESAELLDLRIPWSSISSAAIDMANVRRGVRVELSALLYSEVVDFVNRERQCCGDWLHLELVRQDELLLLTATADTVEYQSIIRSRLGIGPPGRNVLDTGLPDNVMLIRAKAQQWQAQSSNG